MIETFANSSGNANLKSMKIKVIVQPSEDGYFVAHVPSLKSCWSQGKTKEEALRNIREAIDLYLGPGVLMVLRNTHHVNNDR